MDKNKPPPNFPKIDMPVAKMTDNKSYHQLASNLEELRVIHQKEVDDMIAILQKTEDLDKIYSPTTPGVRRYALYFRNGAAVECPGKLMFAWPGSKVFQNSEEKLALQNWPVVPRRPAVAKKPSHKFQKPPALGATL